MGILLLCSIFVHVLSSAGSPDRLIDRRALVQVPGLFGWLNPRNYVSFLLWTRENPDDPQRLYIGDVNQLTISNFQPNVSTKVIIHGFTEDLWRPGTHYAQMRQAFLLNSPCNVIGVSWEYLSLIYTYHFAASNTQLVGQQVSKLLDFLYYSSGVSLETLHLIGFSLGAHVAGYAGQNVRRGRIGRITGLDPAGPAFQFVGDNERLSADDAIMVDVIHTNGGAMVLKGLGLLDPVGHADFYINGGRRQPGCSSADGDIQGLSCNHIRASLLFTESINSNTPFFACKCSSWRELHELGQCSCPTLAIAGAKLSSRAQGIYYVSTNAQFPFVKKLPNSDLIADNLLV